MNTWPSTATPTLESLEGTDLQLVQGTSRCRLLSLASPVLRAVGSSRLEICNGGELFDRIVADGKFTEKAALLV